MDGSARVGLPPAHFRGWLRGAQVPLGHSSSTRARTGRSRRTVVTGAVDTASARRGEERRLDQAGFQRTRLRRLRARAEQKSASSAEKAALNRSGCGTTTTSRPGDGFCRRNASRTRRLARLRRTAPPSLRVAATPSRATVSPFGRTNSVSRRPRTRAPWSYTCRNSARRLIRSRDVSRSVSPGPGDELIRTRRSVVSVLSRDGA